MDVSFEVLHRAKNVNSKSLLNQLVSLVTELADDYILCYQGSLVNYNGMLPNLKYDYDQLVEFLDMYMEEELQKNRIITVYDVIGDRRNNDPLDVRLGQINITIKYQQFNCVNMTQIDFSLIDK